MKIKVSKIKKDNIFTDEFLALSDNNIIDFDSKNVCVLYGPNGTGKTSLAKILGKEDGVEYIIHKDNNTFTEKESAIAHIISDQNDRNIIQGETQDFILGDNIQKEYSLKQSIELTFSQLFSSELVKLLKEKYKINKKSTHFDNLLMDEKIKNYISDIANAQSRGKKINETEFIDKIFSLSPLSVPDYAEEKFTFFINDYSKDDSIIRAIKNYNFKLNGGEINIVKIEEQNEALSILNKFSYMHECLVCDNPIDINKQIEAKTSQRKKTFDAMSREDKEIADKITQTLSKDDPFKIKENLREAINTSNKDLISILVAEFNTYSEIYWKLLYNDFISTSKKQKLKDDFNEYQQLTQSKPEFGHEDILFIEQFLNESLERPISLSRDEKQNIKLTLGGKDFLNKDRKELQLSNGEQNFLSLAFELLKAKKTDKDLIVLDDPISSFDSIYKNKLAYAILSFLRNKKILILTHNTELIKLLEHQVQKCLNLYYFNNVEGENNGFIIVNQEETSLLLYIHEFLNLLRSGICNEIDNEQHFIVSLIPFMRSLCQIFGFTPEKNKLTKLMHGYCNDTVNITEIYEKIFSSNVISQKHELSAQDIIRWDYNSFTPLKPDKYPLLSKTLRHTLTYLFLRLNVERKLVDKFNIDTGRHDMLSSIIHNSFPGKESEEIKNRVFFMSKKTLLNEFNHFEMDMNIFQPAIDITDKSLNKEREKILKRLGEI